MDGQQRVSSTTSIRLEMDKPGDDEQCSRAPENVQPEVTQDQDQAQSEDQAQDNAQGPTQEPTQAQSQAQAHPPTPSKRLLEISRLLPAVKTITPSQTIPQACTICSNPIDPTHHVHQHATCNGTFHTDCLEHHIKTYQIGLVSPPIRCPLDNEPLEETHPTTRTTKQKQKQEQNQEQPIDETSTMTPMSLAFREKIGRRNHPRNDSLQHGYAASWVGRTYPGGAIVDMDQVSRHLRVLARGECLQPRCMMHDSWRMEESKVD